MNFIDSIVNLLSPRPKYATRRVPSAPSKHPRMSEDDHHCRESELRKQATDLKKQKRYDEAVRFLRLAREEQYKTDCKYDMQTLLRVPKYLILAGRYNDAISELKDLLAGKWNTNAGHWLARKVFDRQMIFDALIEAAEKSNDVELVKLCRTESASFVDDVVKARIMDVKHDFMECASEVNFDLGVVSSDCGCKGEPCEKWHGFVLSVLGKTEGWPTIDDIDATAIFHPDTFHRIDFIDEYADAETIAKAKKRQLAKVGQLKIGKE